jgi:hypothetical protein
MTEPSKPKSRPKGRRKAISPLQLAKREKPPLETETAHSRSLHTKLRGSLWLPLGRIVKRVCAYVGNWSSRGGRWVAEGGKGMGDSTVRGWMRRTANASERIDSLKVSASYWRAYYYGCLAKCETLKAGITRPCYRVIHSERSRNHATSRPTETKLEGLEVSQRWDVTPR